MVQDYFKYDKIQGATSLVVNSNDGTKTQENLGLPLGIKSTVQGIQHFTNWSDVSSSIDAKNTLRFEDAQPNKIFYRTNRTRAANWQTSTFNATAGIVNIQTPNAAGDNFTEFTDEWHVDDIKILDDIAIVSYPDYTDIQRTEKTFTGLQLFQPVRRTYIGGYSEPNTDFRWYGGLVFTVEGLPLMHEIFPTTVVAADNRLLVDDSTGNSSTNPSGAVETHLDNKFYNFENTILKVKIPRTSLAGQADIEERYLYFVYGGAAKSGGMPVSLSSDSDGSFLFDDFRFATSTTTQYSTIYDNEDANRQWYSFDDGDFAGYFYLVTEESSTLGKDYSFERTPSGNIHIQLSVRCVLPNDEAFNAFVLKYNHFNDASTVIDVGYIEVGDYGVTPSVEATFIKFTPVRQCGKVEVYTKKSGIISSAANNRITSPGHSLQTNDIIKITSALWDGTQTGTKDTHPLNGNKFVKVIDVDTFDLYEDQYFSNPSTTVKLRTTDGISWVCIGSSNGNDAQSWKYVETLFSPTGRNGYKSTTNKYKTSTRYNTAYLCPSNAEDKDIQNNSIYLDFSIFKDAGSTGLSLAYAPGRNWGIYNSNGAQTRYPDFSVTYTQANKLGKMIEDFLESLPSKDLGASPLDAFHKGPQDFFPFTTRDLNTQFSPSYTGTRFGAAIDFKFSHNSGNSKIYTLAVGEPGSDISVDMFGIDNDEYAPDGNIPFWLQIEPGSSSQNSLIANIGRKRIMPYYQPHGKIHIFTVTIDQYGRVSDITAQNSVFGDGSSVNNTCSNEQHPWEAFMTLVRANHYVGVDTNTGRRQMQSWSYDDGVFDTGYTSSTNGSRASYISMQNRAPFYEVLPDNSSLYWDRAAIVNWFPVEIYDYFANNDSELNKTLLRKQYVPRNSSSVDQSTVLFSRFGSGVGNKSIDRFNVSLENNASQFYIMPWVDMFGKSVAISNTNASGEIFVFGSVSTRSNIDYHTVPRNRYDAFGSYGETALRPVYADYAGINSSNIEEYCISQIGQISCIRIDRDVTYNTTQIVEINSGGSVDSSTTPVDIEEVFERQTTSSIPFTIKQLRQSEKLGEGYIPVLRSIRTSASSIIFEDNYLFWADHNLNDRHSKIHMFSVDLSNNSFVKNSSITHNFVNQILTQNSSDGCGLHMRYSKGVLLTNMLISTNDFLQSVSSITQGVLTKYDAIVVHQADEKGIKYLQKLTPTFSSLDERYNSKLVSSYSNELLDIRNINYDNNSYGSRTWNMRMIGKYDVISDKILLKDPVEYILFSADATYSRLQKSNTRSNTRTIKPYLSYTEVFRDDTVYYDYGIEYGKDGHYRVMDKTLWQDVNFGELTNIENTTRTPVFFLTIPHDSISTYGNLSITINKNDAGRIFASYWNIDSFEEESPVSNSYLAPTPKIALYKKDPRAMIIPNGPAATNTDQSAACPYTNGIYDYWWSEFKLSSQFRLQTPATPPLFRGGANDLFHYYSNPGSVPSVMVDEINSTFDYTYAKQYFNGETNLGELFDATYNQNGNVNKGIISWFANDVRRAAVQAGVDRGEDATQYGTIYSLPVSSSANGFTFNIPYSIWSQFVVSKPLLKTSADNRPFFGSFTRIKHGTAGIDLDPPTGLWDYTYDDKNRPTYISRNVTSDFSLIIGLVFTRNETINQNGDVSYDTNNAFYDLARFIGPQESERQRYSSNYSYTSLIGGTENANNLTNFSKRKTINNLHLETYINHIDFKVDITSVEKRKYKSKYHKIAYFEYNNEVYSDTQRNLIDSMSNDVERYAFGKYSFTPLPIGQVVNFNNNTQNKASKNPIIRVGNSKSSTQISQGGNGAFNNSIQVLTSENLGNKLSIDTTFYADNDTIYSNFSPSGYSLGPAYFSNRSMIGGFDFDHPESLTLSIFVAESEANAADLFIKDQRSSGNIDFSIYGREVREGDTTLFISTISRFGHVSDLSIRGVFDYNNETDLYLQGADIDALNNSVNLGMFATIGTGHFHAAELFVSAPIPNSGNISLQIGKDIDHNDETTLFIVSQFVTPGYTFHSTTSRLTIKGLGDGVFVNSSGMPLKITGPDVYTENSLIPLHITTEIPPIGIGGGYEGFELTTLTINANNEDNIYTLSEKSSTITIAGAVAVTGSMPLYIERDWANGITLIVKNQNPTSVIPIAISGAFVSSGDISLYVSPPAINTFELFTRGYVE